MAKIEVRGLRKAFGDHVVLDHVDLDVQEGEFLTMIGGSASGKSLLVKLLIGLMPIDAGSIRVDGVDVTKYREREWVKVRREIGVMFQNSALFDSLSVLDNVAYGLREQRLLSEPEIVKRVSESLHQVSLPGIEKMRPAELSGGMRKRVALARAIALRPRVLFYDGPDEGLDPINVTRVNRLLLRLRDEHAITTVVITQNMHSAFATSDRIVLLSGGRIVADGKPDEIRSSSDERLRPFVRAARALV